MFATLNSRTRQGSFPMALVPRPVRGYDRRGGRSDGGRLFTVSLPAARALPRWIDRTRLTELSCLYGAGPTPDGPERKDHAVAG